MTFPVIPNMYFLFVIIVINILKHLDYKNPIFDTGIYN